MGERRSAWDNLRQLSPMQDYRTTRVAPAETSMTELLPPSARMSQVQPQYNGGDNQVMPYQPNRSPPWTVNPRPSNVSAPPPSTKTTSAGSPSKNFIIVVSVIGLLIGLCITGIPLGVLTTSYLQLKSQGSSNNGDTNSQGSAILPTQCSTYTNISDASRLTTCTGVAYYDCSWTAAWYRIVGGAGTKLAMAPASNSYCCTSYPGWFNGTLPATTGASTVGMYCTQYSGYVCYAPYSLSTILVTNCGDFYIYFLPAFTTCTSRYCTSP